MQAMPMRDPDGTTAAGSLVPDQRRVSGGPIVNGSGEGVTSQTSNPGTTSSTGAGLATGVASFGLGMSPLGQVPGVNAGVNAAMQGNDLDAIQDAVLGGLLGWSGSEATAALGLGYGLPGIVGSVTAESVKDNPNYGAAALGTAARTGSAILGTMVGGPLVGMVTGSLGGYLADQSLKEGYLGDFAGSRSRERARDSVEDHFGVGVDATSEMANMDAAMGSMAGDIAFGLTSHDRGTPAGRLSSAMGEDPFGTMSSLESFLGTMPSFEEFEGVDTSAAKSDPRSDWGRSMNNASTLGDRDLSPEQNMDRQPSETPGGLLGGYLGEKEKDDDNDNDNEGKDKGSVGGDGGYGGFGDGDFG
jgi:hypothetical protein